MPTTNSKSAITGKPVWFITGCSTGIGRELAKHMLECGYRSAHVIVKATESLNPPHRLLLGNDAYEAATAKLEDLRKEFSLRWKRFLAGLISRRICMDRRL